MNTKIIGQQSIGSGAALAGDRVAGFDLLRGICAIAVLVYHVLAWNDWAHLYNWGTYGVYIFFVLSGASMYVAYSERFAKGYSIAKFLALRLIRLLPLYLMAMVLALAIKFMRSGADLSTIGMAYLNAFLLFGLGNPGSTSQVTGGWSIGIEFVFYLVFPVLLALVSGKRWLWVLLVAFTSQHVFINTVLHGATLVESWSIYTQFLAFGFYFAAGCAIGRAMQEGWLRASWLGAPLLVGALAVLALTSQATSEASLTGLLGILLSLLAVTAVASSATLQFRFGGHRLADLLGKSSYGVYILHPLIGGTLKTVAKSIPMHPATILGLTVVMTVVLALLVERYLEQPAQRYLKARLAR